MKTRLILPALFFLCLVAVPARAQTSELVGVTHEELKAVLESSPAELNVVNFWATWCVPCREEFPDLVRFERDYAGRGVRLIFVSTDFDEDLPAAREFLARQEVSGKTYLKRGDDQQFISAMHGRWSGALPATFIYRKGGDLETFWEGKATYDELVARVGGLLEKGKSN